MWWSSLILASLDPVLTVNFLHSCITVFSMRHVSDFDYFFLEG